MFLTLPLTSCLSISSLKTTIVSLFFMLLGSEYRIASRGRLFSKGRVRMAYIHLQVSSLLPLTLLLLLAKPIQLKPGISNWVIHLLPFYIKLSTITVFSKAMLKFLFVNFFAMEKLVNYRFQFLLPLLLLLCS